MTRHARLQRALLTGVLAVVTVVWSLPLVVTSLTSLRTFDDVATNGVTSWPKSFTLENFTIAWSDGNLDQYLATSLIVTCVGVAIVLTLASGAAFALSRRMVPFARTLMLLFLAGNLLPPQMLIIPVFEFSDSVGLYDTKTGLIAINAAFQLGFAIFVLYNFMRTIPGEIFEASTIDGAGPVRAYGSVMLPLMRPALAAVGTLQFTWIYNDLLWAVVLIRSDENRPVTSGLLGLRGEFVTSWPTISAGAVIAAAPVLLVFLAFQKQFVSGLTLGAGK